MNLTVILLLTVFVIVGIGFIIFQNFADYALRTKFILAFIGVSIFTVGIVVFVTSWVTRDALFEAIGFNLADRAAAEGTEIGNFLVGQIGELRVLAINEVLRDQIRTRNSGYSDDVSMIKPRLLEIDSRWRIVDDENLLVRSKLVNPLAMELVDFKEIFPDYVELFVTDRYGAIIGATNRTEDYFQADESWWQQAFNEGQGAYYIGQVGFDESSDILAIDIAVPVFDDQTNEVIGVLRSTFRTDPLTTALSRASIGNSRVAEIILPGGAKLSPSAAEQPDVVDSEVLSRIEQLDEGEFSQLNYEGVPSLVSKAPVRPIEANAAVQNLGWEIVFHQNIAEALRPVTSLLIASFLTATGAVLLSAVAAFGFANVIVGPISRLTETALQVSKGNLQFRAPIESKDETGQLAEAFNSMTGQLQGFIGSLESQVQARTAELALSMAVGQKAAAIRELDQLLPTITEFIREQFDLYYVQIYLVDDTGKKLVLKKGTGTLGDELLEKQHALPIDSASIVGRAYNTGQVVMVEDLKKSSFDTLAALLPESRSGVALPLIVEDKVVGVLDMYAKQVNTFNQNNLTVFEAMATHLAISIDSAWQWAASQQAQQRAEEALRQLTQENWRKNLAERREPPAYSYDLSAVVPLASPAKNGDLSVPVTVQNQAIGELSVTTADGRAFSEDERALMDAIAQQLGQKAETLRLFEQTQQRATREQIARQITDKIRSSRDVESALKTAAVELSKALGTTRAVIDLQVQRPLSESDKE